MMISGNGFQIIMSKVYVPSYTNGNCATVYSSNTLRVFDSVPANSTTITYTDYFLNSHYLSRTGSYSFDSSELLPSCISSDNISTDYWYRNDFDSILVILFILLIICIYFPIRLISRIFGRWLKW